MKSYSAIREADNKRLAKEGKPYSYDAAGIRVCAYCMQDWQQEHGKCSCTTTKTPPLDAKE